MRLIASLVVLVAACDIPTDLPKWNPTFAVPLEGTTIPIAQLLPGAVEIGAPGSTFVISVPSFSFQRRLFEVCPGCRGFDGQIIPKPAFQGFAGFPIPFPVGIDSASVVSGSATFTVTNGWNFDPLRPAAGQFGSLAVQVISREAVVHGFSFFSGHDVALPSGGTLTGTINFAGAPLQTPFLSLSTFSPAGDPVRIDEHSAVTVTLRSGQFTATDLTARIGTRQVTSLPLQLDLTGVDEFIIHRVRGGKLLITTHNDFGVTGNMTLAITGGIRPVSKTFALPAADTTLEIPLLESDLESILGRSVVASIHGFVSTARAVVITPTSSFRVEPLLVLELGPDS